MRKQLKHIIAIRVIYRFWMVLKDQYHFNLISFFTGLASFIHDYNGLVHGETNPNFTVSGGELTPFLRDKTVHTPLEPVYFYQDTWAAGKIFSLKPAHHYDVGSSAMTVGILSQFVPTTMVDIRPVELALKNLFFQEGSIVALPFSDSSIESLSSLCVVEHIGLGRYGDPVDPWGSEKAARELKRVLKAGGNLLISLPIDEVNRVYFNAHRAFTREYILKLFAGLELVEERYIYGKAMSGTYEKSKGFGTGLFHFRKGLA